MAAPNIPNSPQNASDLLNILGATAKGFVKNCRFLVMLLPPPSLYQGKVTAMNIPSMTRDLAFLCEAAEWAGRSLQTVDARHYGPQFKMPFLSTYNDMNLTFMCRNEMKEKRFFDLWMNKINPNNSYNFNYLNDYATSINIYTLNEAGAPIYQQVIEKAYPIIVNPVQTTWADDQIARLNVTFTYREYKTKEDPPPLGKLKSLVADAATNFDGNIFLGDPFNTEPNVR